MMKMMSRMNIYEDEALLLTVIFLPAGRENS